MEHPICAKKRSVDDWNKRCIEYPALPEIPENEQMYIKGENK